MRFTSLLVVAFAPAIAAAQMIDVQPGARIRVIAPGVLAGRVEGIVGSRTADSVIVLTSQPTQYRIALSSISGLQVSQGKSRLKGAGKGAIWGGAIMLVMSAAVSGSSEIRQVDEYGPPMSVPGFIAMETVGGAMIGAGIGAIVGSERWSSYETPTRVTVGVGKSRVGLNFAF